MEQYRSAQRFGVSVVCLTLLFRILELGLPGKAVSLLKALPETSNIQTDAVREARHSSFPFPQESSAPMDYVPEPSLPVFLPEQAAEMDIRNTGGKEADYAALLTRPLSWQLAGTEPRVLILHTHTTESYEPGTAGYAQTAPYRTLDEAYNMLCIGDALAEALEAAGIPTVHDREFHDYPSYNSAYTQARKAIQANMQAHPGILLVLDLHRDAAGEGGRQLGTHVTVAGRETAQLMTVLGVGRSGLENPRWEDNLSLALKLQLLLEAQAPGITRPLSLRPQRFNQDLAPYTLLIEVGTAGNTQEEALRATRLLADALIRLKAGTQG